MNRIFKYFKALSDATTDINCIPTYVEGKLAIGACDRREAIVKKMHIL